MLSQQHIDTVKSTIPLLESVGSQITDHFYVRMFTHNPELKDIFNMSHQHSGGQSVALFNALAAYATHIDNLPVLTAAVERIAQKHTSFNIRPEHYDIVGHHLIETLRELAADAFTPEIEEAWVAAYGLLASVFIGRESELYTERAAADGGWSGPRRFRLIEKRIESELVKSLVFEPVDGQPVIGYQPGQYLGVKVKPTTSEHIEIRQYSLSDTPNGETYRISVKREAMGVPGQVSNYLHDGLRLNQEVELLAPAGDFLFTDRQRPVVAISAGVGLTPMISILETLAKQGYSQPIHYLHACENVEQHSFRKRVNQLAEVLPLTAHTWYNQDHSDAANTHHGLMDLSLIKEELPLNDGDFYLCGPTPFMRFIKQQLLNLGAAEDQIHYEVFGPHQDF
ncbi:NO-inducible flavohemoprotein [Aliamphritea spongicola]|uniref:NO-inducible flavohemoprotein n=1 Tax=Aliamphritea spongicola TaxID=707589 RepID=UPI00196B1096|nr:NO-inducible flavohemoprotein [Aliamphritea spongicola]MBN3561007.1 NO-inducible flavohemoprotein [Aliamphritea spongicola]